jgi:histidine kinase-like protein
VIERQICDGDMRLVVPASPEHLRAVRLVAADAAGRAGLDCEETDDLRIAVDEVCHALMRVTDQPILLGIAAREDRVAVEGSVMVGVRASALPLHPLSEAILRSVTDAFDIVVDGREMRFRLVKRKASVVSCG